MYFTKQPFPNAVAVLDKLHWAVLEAAWVCERPFCVQEQHSSLDQYLPFCLLM